MESPEPKPLQLQFDETSMPRTVFANHVEVVGVDGYTTVTFYSVVFPRAAHLRSDPPSLTARPVAQVVLPGEKWAELIANINRENEAAREGREKRDDDGAS
jgi:hypothetical protein